MAKPNYSHLKKQRDQARKARQDEKRLKKQARAEAAAATATDPKATT